MKRILLGSAVAALTLIMTSAVQAGDWGHDYYRGRSGHSGYVPGHYDRRRAHYDYVPGRYAHSGRRDYYYSAPGYYAAPPVYSAPGYYNVPRYPVAPGYSYRSPCDY